MDDKGEGLSAVPMPIVLWVQFLIHSFIFAENIIFIIMYFYHGKIYVTYNLPLQLHLVAFNTCTLLYHHPSPKLFILQN